MRQTLENKRHRIRVDRRVLFYRRNVDFANFAQRFATIATRDPLREKKSEKKSISFRWVNVSFTSVSQSTVPIVVSVANASTGTRMQIAKCCLQE